MYFIFTDIYCISRNNSYRFSCRYYWNSGRLGTFLRLFLFFKDSFIRLRWQTRILIIFCMSIAIVYSAIITYETIIQYDNFTLERFSANSLVSSREQLINTGKQVISEFNLTGFFWVRVFLEDDLL